MQMEEHKEFVHSFHWKVSKGIKMMLKSILEKYVVNLKIYFILLAIIMLF
jgi:hypothetical protein